MLSSPFLAEILSFCLSSSALNFSASLTILSISSLESLPLSLVIVILFCFPVDLSAADTFRIPLASCRKSPQSVELHGELGGCQSDQTCQGCDCLWSSRARPHTPGSSQRAGCRCR